MAHGYGREIWAAKKAFPSCYVPPLVLLAAAAVFQDGFYGDVASSVAILLVPAALWMVFGMWRRPSHEGRFPLAFVGGGIALMAIAAIAGGATYSKLAGLASWSVLPVGLLVGLMVSEAESVLLTRGIAWIGVGCAVATLLVYMGALPLDGFVNAARVQSFFQYANAAGIWFAAVALLAVASGDRALATTAPLMTACLLLTQSGGAILASVLGWILFSVLAWRLDKEELALGLWVALACAIVMVACALFVLPIALLPASLACTAALYWILGTNLGEVARKMPKALFLAVSIVAIVIIVLAIVLFPERVNRAAQTFIERFIQMGDGARVLAGDPLLGLGPDQWQFVYLREQSAQYTANVIHNGYLQAVLDGGILSGAFVTAGLVLAWVRSLLSLLGSSLHPIGGAAGEMAVNATSTGEEASVGDENGVQLSNARLAALCASFLLLVHAFLDIDFRFASILLLLGLLLGVTCRAGEKESPSRDERGLHVSIASSVLMAVVAAAALFATVSSGMLAASLVTGDGGALDAFSADMLASNDPELRVEFLEGCNTAGRQSEAIDFAGQAGLPSTGEQALALAKNLYGAGDGTQAESVLLDELRHEPYNYQLFERVAELLREHDASESAVSAFNDQARQSNELLKKGTAVLLRTGHEIEAF